MFSYIITNNMYSNIPKVYEQIQLFDSLNFLCPIHDPNDIT